MEVIKLNELNIEEIISKVEETLHSGGVVAAPTDTVYGILGRADNEETIKKIFAIKKRSFEKAFPIFVKDIPAARKLAYISDAKVEFLEKVWPGAVTVVFHHKEKLPEILTPPISLHDIAGQAGGPGTIGIRIPNHPFLLELLSRLDFPLVQTSANISDKPPAISSAEIESYFGKSGPKPDLIVDVGEISGRASTVIDLTGQNPIVLRTGVVSKEELDRILGIA